MVATAHACCSLTLTLERTDPRVEGCQIDLEIELRPVEIVGGARVLTRTFASGKCYFYIPEGPVLPTRHRIVVAERAQEGLLPLRQRLPRGGNKQEGRRMTAL